MADGGGRPRVVHGPHHGFPAVEHLLDALEREHALVDPMQVNDIGLLELPQPGDVEARVGDVDLKEVLA